MVVFHLSHCTVLKLEVSPSVSPRELARAMTYSRDQISFSAATKRSDKASRKCLSRGDRYKGGPSVTLFFVPNGRGPCDI